MNRLGVGERADDEVPFGNNDWRAVQTQQSTQAHYARPFQSGQSTNAPARHEDRPEKNVELCARIEQKEDGLCAKWPRQRSHRAALAVDDHSGQRHLHAYAL